MAHLPSLPLLGGLPFLRIAPHAITPRPQPALPGAPVFKVLPSIAGTPRVGQALTGMDGTITGGTVVSRRWLLGAAVVSTAKVYLPTATGALVYEVTAIGPGGTTVASSAAVTVAAALPAGALRPIPPVNFNPDYLTLQYGGYGFALVNRFLTSAYLGYEGSSGDITLDSRGYPIPPDAGRTWHVLVNIEGKYGPQDKQNYVYESNIPGFRGNVLNSTGATTTVENGITKVRFHMPPAPNDQYPFVGADRYTLFYFGYDQPVQKGQYIACYRADEEAQFRSGQYFRDQYVAWHAGFGMRYMDWMEVNDYDDMNGIVPADAMSFSAFTTKPRPPLEAIAEFSNRLATTAWVPIPFSSTDDQITKLVQFMLQNLAPDQRILFECDNEVWNGQFASSYNSAFVVRNPNNETDVNKIPQVPHTHGGGQNAGYGWWAANMMAKVLIAGNFDHRIEPVLASMNTNTEATLGIFEGVNQAILDWNDPTSRYHNPTFAAHFTCIADLFAHGAVATYFDGGFGDYATMDATNKAIVDDLANRYANGDMTALDKMFEQLYHGTVWNSANRAFIDNIANEYGPQVALFEGVGLNTVAYEHQLSSELAIDAKRRNLFVAMLHDPRAIALQAAGINANLNIGISATFELSDIAEPGGTFNASDYAYDQSAPRMQGSYAVRDNPAAIKPLAVTVTTSNGSLQVGRSPLHHLTITGGRGLKTVTFTGLAPGQASGMRGRQITGALITAGEYDITYDITDEWGTHLTGTIPQNVLPAATGVPAGRFFRFTVADSFYQDRIGSREFRFNGSDGNVIAPAGWTATATADSGGNPPGRLVDVATDADYISDGKGAGCVIVIDTKAPRKPASIDILSCGAVFGFTMIGMKIEASVDGATGWRTVANHPASAGWDYGPGFVNIPLDFSGAVE